jgi:hypothetical protein
MSMQVIRSDRPKETLHSLSGLGGRFKIFRIDFARINFHDIRRHSAIVRLFNHVDCQTNQIGLREYEQLSEIDLTFGSDKIQAARLLMLQQLLHPMSSSPEALRVSEIESLSTPK